MKVHSKHARPYLRQELENFKKALDAVIVIDDHCTGSRFFWNEVIPNGDRPLAIAERYCNQPRCPSKDWEERSRFPHILKLAKAWGVQGAIIVQQKFCDPQECDIHAAADV